MIQSISKFGFDIVHGCQLRCIGCPNSTIKPKIKQISPEDFNTCLNNVDVSHVEIFRLFNFGEAVLHKQLPDILKILSRQTWSIGLVELSTNGQYHDFDILEDAIKTGVINRITVSCDGDGTPEDYERLRPPGKWDKLLIFLRKTKELCYKYSSRMTLVSRTICTDPIAQKRWMTLMQELGWVTEFRDWIILPEAPNMTNRQPKVPKRICSFIAGANLYVDYDGTVIPCCAHPKAGDFGNLLTQRYSEILAGPRRLNMIQKMNTDRMTMPLCNNCEF